jgi:tetratricopeptide (TPR) repeat protein
MNTMQRLPLVVLLAILCQATPVLAEPSINSKAAALLAQAQSEINAKQFPAAQKSLQAAMAADPYATRPRTLLGEMLIEAWRANDSHMAWHYRGDAHRLALEALELEDEDSGALGLLDMLSGKFEQPRHEGKPAAQAALEQADRAYYAGQHDEALALYARTIKLDPAFADAYVALGDFHADLNRVPLAQQAFRQAILVEPNHAGAWRALAESLLKERKDEEAVSAALASVSALPTSTESWKLLRGVMKVVSKPLAIFEYRPMGSYSRHKGKVMIVDGMPKPDSAAWQAFGKAQSDALQAKQPVRTAFETELAAWEAALPVIAAMPDAAQIRDDTMRAMLRFHKAGQLKAALFVLAYRERYRADFESWKKTNPDAIRRFVETFRLSA